MSRRRSPVINFHCTNDCSSMGCPGHTMQRVDFLTADTISFLMDGQTYLITDDNIWAAMLEVSNEGNKESKS